MTTKEEGYIFKKLLSVANHGLLNDNSNQFSDFNLNQGHKYPSLVQSFSKSNNDKYSETIVISGGTANNDYKEERKAWNKSTNDSNLIKSKNSRLSHETEKETENQKRWKNDKEPKKLNSSTLSLHITAYENYIESLSNNDTNNLQPKSKASKFVEPLSKLHNYQDLLEFPRQMEDDESSTTPQVQQFTASQRLYTPNQGAPSSSPRMPQSSQMQLNAIRVPRFAQQPYFQLISPIRARGICRLPRVPVVSQRPVIQQQTTHRQTAPRKTTPRQTTPVRQVIRKQSVIPEIREEFATETALPLPPTDAEPHSSTLKRRRETSPLEDDRVTKLEKVVNTLLKSVKEIAAENSMLRSSVIDLNDKVDELVKSKAQDKEEIEKLGEKVMNRRVKGVTDIIFTNVPGLANLNFTMTFLGRSMTFRAQDFIHLDMYDKKLDEALKSIAHKAFLEMIPQETTLSNFSTNSVTRGKISIPSNIFDDLIIQMVKLYQGQEEPAIQHTLKNTLINCITDRIKTDVKRRKSEFMVSDAASQFVIADPLHYFADASDETHNYVDETQKERVDASFGDEET